MLSFLPKKEKQEILKEYHVRAISTGLLFVALLFLVASIGLLPSYLSEKVQTNAVVAQFPKPADSSMTPDQATKRQSSNKMLSDYLTAESKKLNPKNSPSVTISKCLKNKPNSISVNSINLSSKNLTIGGVAKTRTDLVAFQKSLQEEGYFKDVNLPISSIAKSTDADFTLELSLP